jgi:hypothetical protein
MSQLAPLDLTQFTYPATLPLDVALRTASRASSSDGGSLIGSGIF